MFLDCQCIPFSLCRPISLPTPRSLHINIMCIDIDVCVYVCMWLYVFLCRRLLSSLWTVFSIFLSEQNVFAHIPFLKTTRWKRSIALICCISCEKKCLCEECESKAENKRHARGPCGGHVPKKSRKRAKSPEKKTDQPIGEVLPNWQKPRREPEPKTT